MSPGDLANSLRGVPPVTLDIFRLAWLVCDQRGQPDAELFLVHQAEWDRASEQAEAYTVQVGRVIWELKRCTASR